MAAGVAPLAAGYAVLNLGSNEPGRRWPLAAFLEMAEHLARRGLKVVFTGGRVEAGFRAPVAEAARARPGAPALSTASPRPASPS